MKTRHFMKDERLTSTISRTLSGSLLDSASHVLLRFFLLFRKGCFVLIVWVGISLSWICQIVCHSETHGINRWLRSIFSEKERIYSEDSIKNCTKEKLQSFCVSAGMKHPPSPRPKYPEFNSVHYRLAL